MSQSFERTRSTGAKWVKIKTNRQRSSQDERAESIVSDLRPHLTLEEIQPRRQFIDMLGQWRGKTSASSRSAMLAVMCDLLTHHHLPNVVAEYQAKILDCVQRSFRKDDSKCAVTRLMMLLMIQSSGDNTAITSIAVPLLLDLIEDPAALAQHRAESCMALSLFALVSGDIEFPTDLAFQSVERILKGKSGKNSVDDNNTLQAAALFTLCLLLISLPQPKAKVKRLLSKDGLLGVSAYPFKLSCWLRSSCPQLRMAAANALGLVVELARQHKLHVGELLEVIRLDVEKRFSETKHQRPFFRSLLTNLRNVTAQGYQSRFGLHKIYFSTWRMRHIYDALCSAVGPGLTLHMEKNNLIRSLFELDSSLERMTPLDAKLCAKSIRSDSMENSKIKRKSMQATRSAQRQYLQDVVGFY